MALRKIRTENDAILRKRSKEVTNINDSIKTLVRDMIDTMYSADGVGLAAVQVGILKRVVVIDVGNGVIVMINPEILEYSGEQTDSEGCLSCPSKSGLVTRPFHVKAKAIDLDGNEIMIEGDELLARAICHEIDHLNGTLFIDIAKEIKMK